MVLDVESTAQAKALLSQDPAIKSNLFKTEFLQWKIDFVAICLPTVPYEMATFQMARFIPANQIASYKTNSDFDMRSKHNEFLEDIQATGQAIVSGHFGNNDGGVLIYQESIATEIIENNPAIKAGYLEAEVSKIWLNLGSFCDQ